jgi:ADP-heptose:LPS heptosyltransferase
VAVIRLKSLGDCVLTTPALQVLKSFRPDLRVAVVVESRFRDLFDGNPDIDAILTPELGTLRGWGPRLSLNLHGGTRSAWLTALSGATHRAGFGHFRHQWVYNHRIPRTQEILRVERKVHTAEHLASAIFHLGAPIQEVPSARLVGRTTESLPSRPYTVIHPVAATREKTWCAEGFVRLARHLDGAVFFVGAQNDDLSAFRDFSIVRGAPLGQIKSLLAGASLFVGNDSGPAHMAAAFGVPSLVIFSKSDPEIWGPWRTPSEVVRAPDGVGQISVEQVLTALSRLRVAA